MRKRLLIGLISLLFVLMCSGCDGTVTGSKDYDIHSELRSINGYDDLYYYDLTKIVYVIFNECAGYSGYGYMAPYYSENGRLCKYEDGKIIEIEEQ